MRLLLPTRVLRLGPPSRLGTLELLLRLSPLELLLMLLQAVFYRNHKVAQAREPFAILGVVRGLDSLVRAIFCWQMGRVLRGQGIVLRIRG